MEINSNWSVVSGKIANISDKLFGKFKGRLLGLLLLVKIEEQKIEEDIDELKNCFKKYSSYVKGKKEEVRGYIQILAKFLELLMTNYQICQKEKKSIYNELCKKIYASIKKHILDSNSSNTPKYQPLQRLRPEHYDEFIKIMLDFYENIQESDWPNSIKKDREAFLRLLFKLEKDDLNDLAWQKRNLKMALNNEDEYGIEPPNTKDLPKDRLSEIYPLFCKECFSKRSTDSKEKFQLLNFNKCEWLKYLAQESEGKLHPPKLDLDDYHKIIDNWNEHFLDYLKSYSIHIHKSSQPALHFLGLRRWNSASPALGKSVGGGYLIYHNDKNGKVDFSIAVDPGFDFLRNLFHLGFSLADIDVVLLSHAHPDHIRDYESIVMLCLELKNRKKQKKKLHTVMTLGVYRRLERVIESPELREFMESYILDIEKEINPEFIRPYLKKIDEKIDLTSPNHAEETSFKFVPASKKDELTRIDAFLPNDPNSQQEMTVKIVPTRAYHNDYSEYSDGFGFKIYFEYSDSEKKYVFGYTGDTSWHKDILGQYSDCDTLLLHLGSLIERGKKFENYKEPEECFKLVKKKNHPYFVGLFHFLNEVKNSSSNSPPLILIGEFGEELRGGIRLDFIKRLDQAYPYFESKILPVDVGLDILLYKDEDGEKGKSSENTKKNPKALCVQCQKFVSIDKAYFEIYGHDEALFCVCKTCKKSTAHDVLSDRLRFLYEVGREVQTHL